jgi:hypothetical protein
LIGVKRTRWCFQKSDADLHHRRAVNALETTDGDKICRNGPIGFTRLRGRREFDLLKIRSIFAMTTSSLGVAPARAGIHSAAAYR